MTLSLSPLFFPGKNRSFFRRFLLAPALWVATIIAAILARRLAHQELTKRGIEQCVRALAHCDVTRKELLYDDARFVDQVGSRVGNAKKGRVLFVDQRIQDAITSDHRGIGVGKQRKTDAPRSRVVGQCVAVVVAHRIEFDTALFEAG